MVFSRKSSYFYNMRKFHNEIKRDLYNRFSNNIENLLELAVGKGGDLDKWVKNGVKNVEGYDIDKKSIVECRRRVNVKKSDVNVKVYVKDLSKEIIKSELSFDVVASMFSFHYFFETEDTFKVIMESIVSNIKPGGIFMGVLFDGAKLKEVGIEVDLKERCDENVSRFKISGKDNNVLFGNKIKVYINDTVLDTPMDEYIVVFEDFVRLMKEYNFILIETRMFEEYLGEFNPELSEIEKSVSFLNRTFVFRKTSNCVVETGYLMKCEWGNDKGVCKKENEYLMLCEFV